MVPSDEARYNKPPSPAEVQAAEQIRKHAGLKPMNPQPGDKRPKPASNPSNSNQPSAKDPKSGSSKNSKKLVLNVRGELFVRDDALNVIRPLTDEERRYDLQIFPCRDRKCTEEAREIENNDEGGVVIPGVGPPSLPSVNAAVPTLVTRIKAEEPDLKRRFPSDGALPVATITPA
ncbi:Hypothetical predicted protein [Lecanosticta acicola]|uniref:Uncharacterized protein n=1 Tax=Lecanosticta acicola TaxID=111012 RepID=A0AAI8Z6M2_9PEZI|nr:Hypothetical predicted protein [Lecanosticta acicola]